MKKYVRWYIHWSSVFDNPKNKYDIPKFIETVRLAGGKNIRTALSYGWSNQPRVVTFSADDEVKDQIMIRLNELPVFQKLGCIVDRKLW
jgi:hypothetical protein